MCEYDLKELLNESGAVIKKLETNQHNGFTDTLNRYRRFKKEGTGLAGERVVVKNIKATYTEEGKGIRANISFDVISANSQKLIGHKRVEVHSLNEKVKNGGLEILYAHLFQLYYSGCHATIEDERNYLTTLEKLNTSHEKEETK